jgi:hypothetical protein
MYSTSGRVLLSYCSFVQNSTYLLQNFGKPKNNLISATPGQVLWYITRDSNLRCDQRNCPKWLTITLQEKLIASTLGIPLRDSKVSIWPRSLPLLSLILMINLQRIFFWKSPMTTDSIGPIKNCPLICTVF